MDLYKTNLLHHNWPSFDRFVRINSRRFGFKSIDNPFYPFESKIECFGDENGHAFGFYFDNHKNLTGGWVIVIGSDYPPNGNQVPDWLDKILTEYAIIAAKWGKILT